MKRFLCALTAVCSLLTMALADHTQQLLWAEEAARELDMMAEAMIMFVQDDPELKEIISHCTEGDHSSPAVIYRYTMDASAVYEQTGMQDETLMRYADVSLWETLYHGYVMICNGLSERVFTALSCCTFTKPFIGTCGNEWWVLSYWDGVDILVMFLDQGNGTVLVSARYMPVKHGPKEMMAVFAQFGVPATYEKIR